MKETSFISLNPEWIRKPENVTITNDTVEVITESGTDLWQRTYYGFTNDNAPVYQVKTDEKFFLLLLEHSLKAVSVLTSAVLQCILTATTGSRLPSNTKMKRFSVLEVL